MKRHGWSLASVLLAAMLVLAAGGTAVGSTITPLEPGIAPTPEQRAFLESLPYPVIGRGEGDVGVNTGAQDAALDVYLQDQDTNPVADAFVMAINGPDTLTATTGADGIAHFDTVTAAVWLVDAWAQFFVEVSDTVIVDDGQDRTGPDQKVLTVDLPPRPENVQVTTDQPYLHLTWPPVAPPPGYSEVLYLGYILDEEGFPVPEPLTTADTAIVGLLEETGVLYGFTIQAMFLPEGGGEPLMSGGSDPVYGGITPFPGYEWMPTEFDWVELADDPDAQYWAFNDSWDSAWIEFVDTTGQEMLFYDHYVPGINISGAGLLYSGGEVNFPFSEATMEELIAPFGSELEYNRQDAAVYSAFKPDLGCWVFEWFSPDAHGSAEWPVVFEIKWFTTGEIEFHYQVVGDRVPGDLLIALASAQMEGSPGYEPLAIYWEGSGWVPGDGTALRFEPGAGTWANLEVNVTDDQLGLPATGIEVLLSTGQVDTTDNNGVARFEWIPLHLGSDVEVSIDNPNYEPFSEVLPLVEGENSFDAVLTPIIGPPSGLDFDGWSNDRIILYWNPPSHAVNEADSWALHDGIEAGFNVDDSQEEVAEGVQYSDFEIDGTYDINGVELYIGQVNQFNQAEARLDIWDITDPLNPFPLYSYSWFPTNVNQWEYVPVGLNGLTHTNIAVTLATPGMFGRDRYDVMWDSYNDYNCAVKVFNADGEGAWADLSQGAMAWGDPLVTTYVTLHGSYINDPRDQFNGGDLLPKTGSAADGPLSRREQLIASGAAVQDAWGRWAPVGRSVRAATPMRPETALSARPHLTFNGAGEGGLELDEYTQDIVYYNIYRDGLLLDTTAAYSGDLNYVDSTIVEGQEYEYTVAAVYDIEGVLSEGPPSDPLLAMAAMPPEPPTLLPFNINEVLLQVIVSWDAPLLNEDNTPLTDLAGYRVYRNGELVQDMPESITTITDVLPYGGFFVYSLTAYDDAGIESAPVFGEPQFIGEPDTLFDFEADDGGFIPDGFEWGAPTAGPDTAYSGDNVWGTNLDGDYEDNTLYTLTLPSLYVENTDAMISFYEWHAFEPYFDGAAVFVSTDEGQSWELLDFDPESTEDEWSIYHDEYWGGPYGNPLSDYGLPDSSFFLSDSSHDGDWEFLGVHLGRYAGRNVLVRFAAGTDMANHLYTGWYLDDVGLYSLSFSGYGDLSGVVTRNDTGEPLEGAVVSIVEISRSTTTGADGSYEFTGVPSGDYTVTAESDGFNEAEASVTIPTDGTATQDFALLHPEIAVDPDHLDLYVVPGVEGTFDLTLTNDGDGPLHVVSWVTDNEHGAPVMKADPPARREPGESDLGALRVVEKKPIRPYAGPSVMRSIAQRTSGEPFGYTVDETVGEGLFLNTWFPLPGEMGDLFGVAYMDGFLYATDPEFGGIFIIDPESGNVVGEIPTPWAPGYEENGDIYPIGLEVHNGQLWMAQANWGQNAGEVLRLDPEGNPDIWFYGQQYGWPQMIFDIAIPPDASSMYYTFGMEGFFSIGVTDAPLFEHGGPGQPYPRDIIMLPGATGLTWHNGYLWATQSVFMHGEGQGALFKVSPDGMIVKGYELPFQSPIIGGLTFDDEGYIWVLDGMNFIFYRLELQDEPDWLFSITGELEVDAGTSDAMSFGYSIPGETPEMTDLFGTITLMNNSADSPLDVPVVIHVGADFTHREMVLEPGWNLVSLDMAPVDPTLPAIFAGAPSLVLVKDGEGRFYDPDTGIDQIGEWDPLAGYKVKVLDPEVLPLDGHELNEQIPIGLEDGWSMVAYLPDGPMPAPDALESLGEALIIAKMGDGRFYLPEWGYDGIGEIWPGDGIQLKLDGPATLVYPEGGVALASAPGRGGIAARVAAAVPRHFETASATGGDMSLLLAGVMVDDSPLSPGDEVEILDPRGVVVASGVWNEEGRLGLAVWGDDPATEEVEGLQPGEPLSARVWLAEEDLELPVSLNAGGEPVIFAKDGIAVASASGSRSSVIPSDYFLAANYPNPFNPTTTIRYGLPQASNVRLEVINLLGRHVATLVDRREKPGYHAVVWDGRDDRGETVASGAYFYRIIAGDFVHIRKMVVMK